MKISRSSFLKIFGAAMVGPCVDPGALLAAADGPPIDREIGPARLRFRLQDASAALFRRHLDSTFSAQPSEGARQRLVLARVTEGPRHERFEQFSLIFHAPAGAVLPAGTHAFRHRALGDLELFIAPIGSPAAQATVYEACFSRRVSAGGE